MAKKYVYTFGGGRADGSAKMKNLLGGKGANLAEMAGLGIPVPAGFTLTTEICTYYYEHRNRYPSGLKETVAKALAKVEKIMGAKFGDAENPLLLSVRSGARKSMPGMMETVLNIGLNDKTREGLIRKTTLCLRCAASSDSDVLRCSDGKGLWCRTEGRSRDSAAAGTRNGENETQAEGRERHRADCE